MVVAGGAVVGADEGAVFEIFSGVSAPTTKSFVVEVFDFLFTIVVVVVGGCCCDVVIWCIELYCELNGGLYCDSVERDHFTNNVKLSNL